MTSSRRHVTNHWSTLRAALCSSRSPKGRHKYSCVYVKMLHQTLWFGSSEEQRNRVVSVGLVWFLKTINAHDVDCSKMWKLTGLIVTHVSAMPWEMARWPSPPPLRSRISHTRTKFEVLETIQAHLQGSPLSKTRPIRFFLGIEQHWQGYTLSHWKYHGGTSAVQHSMSTFPVWSQTKSQYKASSALLSPFLAPADSS